MIALLETVGRLRRRIGLVAALVLLVSLIAWAHTGLTMDGMPEDEVVAVCVAIMQTGVVALAVLALVAAVGPHRLRLPRLSLIAQCTPQPRAVRARAGPATLQVFLR